MDSVALLDALAAAVARSRKGRALHGWARRVRPLSDGRWEMTTEAGECHRACELILCAGAHLPELLGAELLPALALPSLYFAKGIGFVVSGAPAVPHAIRTPNRSDACGVHIVPRADGRLYIGASTHYGHATAAARGVTPGEVSAILGDTLSQIDTRLRDATIAEIRFGLRPIAAGGAPLVGRTSLAGLSLASGADNPWPIPRAQATAPAEDNLALHHLNLGLRAYQAFRLGGEALRGADALRHWRDYRAMAGDQADPRIVALMAATEDETAVDAGPTAAFL